MQNRAYHSDVNGDLVVAPAGGFFINHCYGYDGGAWQPLLVLASGSLRIDLNTLLGNALITGGVNGVLAVGGPAAHLAAAAGNPLRDGGVYHLADPVAADGNVVDILVDAAGRTKIVGAAAHGAATVGNPVLVGEVARAVEPAAEAAGDVLSLMADLLNYLRVSPRSHDYPTIADRSFEVAPVNYHVVEESLVDTTNHAVSAGIQYPSADGIVFLGYKDWSLTGKLIATGGDNAVTLTVQGTNDEDATPANRDWITVYGWRSDTNGVVNSIACGTGATVTYGWDFDEWNYRYGRINLVIVNTGVLSNTVIVKSRRKAL